MNGGKCVEDKGILGYKCNCQTGFTGDTCEKSNNNLYHQIFLEKNINLF